MVMITNTNTKTITTTITITTTTITITIIDMAIISISPGLDVHKFGCNRGNVQWNLLGTVSQRSALQKIK
jgi:hypothetical protein